MTIDWNILTIIAAILIVPMAIGQTVNLFFIFSNRGPKISKSNLRANLSEQNKRRGFVVYEPPPDDAA
ncbi:MAG: hypothetical protein A2941_02650 [Candidatus Yanofskybacteria bacterium RIFCSPLOWO2_01_FULL_49_17]|uniref:Uncharacterized protein n=1 Tax=Candidatus Yanofskybacteria bacterium RIFCSPLOWO2_01_FULL_49_17 TaxID=1802700 RepID=A0A1F8GRX7_9BACT|nr:MAG: hypothetical protein A2941_02650 [Candidatus Yanofskybacteria bacterium RIFCSPLOWO2_01_FULL_49_17]